MESEIIEYFNKSPFRELLGIEITAAADGHAEGRLALSEKHSSSRKRLIAQGGVAFTLADSVGGAATVSVERQPTPTIDFRIDYLRPATRDLRAEADVVRRGSETSFVAVEIHDVDGSHVASGHGVYKTSGLAADAPWDLEQTE